MNFPLNPQMQSKLKQLMDDPKGAASQTKYQIPDDIMNDPKAMVQHLIMTGQVSNPLLQRIMPMIQQMGMR